VVDKVAYFEEQAIQRKYTNKMRISERQWPHGISTFSNVNVDRCEILRSTHRTGAPASYVKLFMFHRMHIRCDDFDLNEIFDYFFEIEAF
jgi:hypothetical protein